MKRVTLLLITLIFGFGFVITCQPAEEVKTEIEKVAGEWLQMPDPGDERGKFTLGEDGSVKSEEYSQTNDAWKTMFEGSISFDTDKHRTTFNIEKSDLDSDGELETLPYEDPDTGITTKSMTMISTYYVDADYKKLLAESTFIGGNSSTLVGEWNSYSMNEMVLESSAKQTEMTIKEGNDVTLNIGSDDTIEVTVKATSTDYATGETTTETLEDSGTVSIDTEAKTITISGLNETTVVKNGTYYYRTIGDGLKIDVEGSATSAEEVSYYEKQ